MTISRENSEKIITLLKKKNLKIASAESVTGGQISAELTKISGSSKVFMAGVTCYSEHSKIHSAGVDVRDLRKHGVYSEIVAKQMAERIMKRNISDIGISTTGCAEGKCKNIETGEVIFGLAKRDKETKIFREKFSGNRNEVQSRATQFALEKILDILEK